MIYLHPKPTNFAESLPQFGDIMRLRATCTTIRDILDKCYLLFASSTNEHCLVQFESALSFMSESNWKFYWLHLKLHDRPRSEVGPLIDYEELFSDSLRVLKVECLMILKSEHFSFLDWIILPVYKPLSNKKTRCEIELLEWGNSFNVPSTSMDIMFHKREWDLQQFRDNLPTVKKILDFCSFC